MNIKLSPNSLLQRMAPALTAGALFLATSGNALAQDAPAKPSANDQSVGDLIVDSGAVGWIIIVLSVVALAIVIENFVSLKREQFQEAMELCENEPNYFTRVCGAGIAKIGHQFETIEKSLEEMGDEESIKLHQKIGWLSLISNVAPMMGLLGTVGGMVEAFNTIASSGGQASPAELAGGISKALLTTMFGLIVAIPVTAAFAFLRNRMVKTIIELGAITEDLFERFREQS